MNAPHPRDGEALDYALGVGSLEERRAFERDTLRDPELAFAVRAWEERLLPLAEALPPVEPRPDLQHTIQRSVSTKHAPESLPFTVPPEIIRLRRSARMWRAATAGASAIAAALGLVLVLAKPAPERPGRSLVAVVNRAGDLPALIVRVDPGTGLVQVRSVSAETPPSSSLELWSIAAGESPRSLGVIGAGTTRIAVPSGRPALGADITLAVTVEPPGGSPSGNPTGPVVYSGKLIPENP